MKNKIKMKFILSAVICLLYTLLIPNNAISAASKDKTPPKISERISTAEYTNTSVKIKIKVTDKSKITAVKWATGAKKISYFKKEGKSLKLDKKGYVTVKASKNGTYTFYAKDSAGNSIKKKVTISNIDKTAPVVETKVNTEEYTNENITISIISADDKSGVKSVRYLTGKKNTEDFEDDKGTLIPLDEAGAAYLEVSNNGSYTICVTDNAGNETITSVAVKNIDEEIPSLSATYSVMNQKATISITAKDEQSGIAKVRYLKGDAAIDAKDWETSAETVTDLSSFKVTDSGLYTILAEDKAGNKQVFPITIEMELRAVWISYLEFLKSKDYTEQKFKAYVDEMFDNCVNMNMNTVIVQVRPASDAMYPSQYFPWSYYASGEQGKELSYDPFEYMVQAAHSRDLSIQAWINPYRVTLSSTDIKTLSQDNPARIWRENKDTQRNVLTINNALYYNPSIREVQNLIINGVKELVKNYDIDGIHFDDYFYPNLGSNYTSNFDAPEYKTYVKECKASGETAKSIVQWRRDNVNTLVKRTYDAIKKIDKNCVFGISPAGNISNLLSSSSYYVDIKTWLSSSGYVDYIAPQIYWSFDHKTAPYKTVVKNWTAIKTSDTVNLYIGLAAYRAGISETTAKNSYGDIGWSQSSTVLKRQVLYGRDTKIADGYIFFRYENMISNTAKKEMKNVISILN